MVIGEGLLQTYFAAFGKDSYWARFSVSFCPVWVGIPVRQTFGRGRKGSGKRGRKKHRWRPCLTR